MINSMSVDRSKKDSPNYALLSQRIFRPIKNYSSPMKNFFGNSPLSLSMSMVNRTSNQRKKYARIEGKHFHYRADGSGRDFYVTINEGGLSKSSLKQKQFNFIDSLRASPQHKNQKQTMNRWKTSNKLFKNKTQHSQNKRQSQKKLFTRLSKPKNYKDPYSKIRYNLRVSLGLKKLR